jgi:hypothetical protein
MDSSGSFSPAGLRKFGKQISEVFIEAPSLNSRRITANIIIDTPIDTVWSILTDYNNLATHVPNLVQSYIVPNPPNSNTNTLRLFQEGAQNIIGFDFRASLLMEMREEREEECNALRESRLCFKLIESRMFDTFDGVWSLKYHSRSKTNDIIRYKTKLTYSVMVRPKGPVPVIALEWRIKEDIPLNLYAVKLASEKRQEQIKDRVDTSSSSAASGIAWGADETLGSYMSSSNDSSGSSVSSSGGSAGSTTVNRLGFNSLFPQLR